MAAQEAYRDTGRGEAAQASGRADHQRVAFLELEAGAFQQARQIWPGQRVELEARPALVLRKGPAQLGQRGGGRLSIIDRADWHGVVEPDHIGRKVEQRPKWPAVDRRPALRR